MPTLAKNSYALHRYTIVETFEAGISLLGPEVKAAKLGQVQLKSSYVSFRDDEVWLINAHIGVYKPAGHKFASRYTPTRPRKLLLKTREMNHLRGRMTEGNLTIIPLKMYTKGAFVKLEIALARSKKQYDKREILKKRTMQREIQQALKNRIAGRQ